MAARAMDALANSGKGFETSKDACNERMLKHCTRLFLDQSVAARQDAEPYLEMQPFSETY